MSPDADYHCSGAKKISVVVIDGVTIGHPCCAIHNCHTPLSNNRNRYCDTHIGSEKTCAIIGCSEKVAPNKRTCLITEHQAVEKVHNERGQARFQLQERLKRARVAHPSDSIGETVNDVSELADVESDEEFELANGKVLPSQASHTSSDPTGKRNNRLRAQYGRKRTHNEQVIVAPCGMIIARETFFGAEAVSSVVVCFFFKLIGFVH